MRGDCQPIVGNKERGNHGSLHRSCGFGRASLNIKRGRDGSERRGQFLKGSVVSGKNVTREYFIRGEEERGYAHPLLRKSPRKN